MRHNVYDFDKTIYQGDSTVDFYFFCLKKRPLILCEIPITAFFFVLYLFGFQTKTVFKESFFRFLGHLDVIEDLTDAFWKTHAVKFADFYLKEHDDNDIVISASPEFLLRPACKMLNIRYLIATKVDRNTGRFSGENCFGEEKRRRLSAEMPDASIGKFFSDSLSDAPLAEIAEEAYIVKGEERISWAEYRPSFFFRIKKTYLSKEFLLFIFCGGMGTLTNFVFSLLISIKVEATFSYVLGYTISLFVAYALNAGLIYNEKCRFAGFIKFVISYIPNFLILFTFVAVFLNLFHWNKILVYALAGLLGLPVTYILVKVFAFGKKER